MAADLGPRDGGGQFVRRGLRVRGNWKFRSVDTETEVVLSQEILFGK